MTREYLQEGERETRDEEETGPSDQGGGSMSKATYIEDRRLYLRNTEGTDATISTSPVEGST